MAKNYLDKNCPFCMKPKNELIATNNTAKAFWSFGAATPGHVLVVPKYHRQTIFDCTDEELLDLNRLMKVVKHKLDNWMHPGGYQIALNCYSIGGQAVPHCHIHVMPRYYNQKKVGTTPLSHIDKFPKDNPFVNPFEQKQHSKGYPYQKAWKVWRKLTHGKIKPKFNAEL